MIPLYMLDIRDYDWKRVLPANLDAARRSCEQIVDLQSVPLNEPVRMFIRDFETDRNPARRRLCNVMVVIKHLSKVDGPYVVLCKIYPDGSTENKGKYDPTDLCLRNINT